MGIYLPINIGSNQNINTPLDKIHFYDTSDEDTPTPKDIPLSNDGEDNQVNIIPVLSTITLPLPLNEETNDIEPQPDEIQEEKGAQVLDSP